jgi:outer membrane protein assembly factor BamA
MRKYIEKLHHMFLPEEALSLNIYRKIDDEKLSDTFHTPHEVYNLAYGYSPNNYSANGFLIALQYNTREHPIRSYGGLYADVNFRFNEEWIGSTKDAIQFQYDIRKYWSLSNRNPEHVFALWHWASYLLSGSLPYLEMPTTGSDNYKRSGRRLIRLVASKVLLMLILKPNTDFR